MDYSLESAANVVTSLAEASLHKADAASNTPNGSHDDTAPPTPSPSSYSSSSRPSRGALLAQLEFLRQAKDNGFADAAANSSVDSAVNLVRLFYDHFGDKASFFADIKTWLPLIQGEDVKRLVVDLAPVVGAANLLETPVNSADMAFPATVRLE